MRFLALLVLAACGQVAVPAVLDPARDSGASAHDAGPHDAGHDAGVDAGLLDAGTDAGEVDAGWLPDPLVVERPYGLTVPSGYQPGRPIPLVMLLHGYTATAEVQDSYFGLSRLAEQRSFLVALPNGLRDVSGNQYWNATDACCAFGKTNDDVAYLTAVIRDVQARYTVDPKRIFLVGHSNGGFMSHRLACDRSELIAAVATVAGNTWKDASRCQPTAPVGVLQVHGSIDSVIFYAGGSTFGGFGPVIGQPYPSASESVSTWAAKNGCGATRSSVGPNLDLVMAVVGNETEREAFAGCRGNGATELWTIWGGAHFPTVVPNFADLLYTWLLAHEKP